MSVPINASLSLIEFFFKFISDKFALFHAFNNKYHNSIKSFYKPFIKLSKPIDTPNIMNANRVGHSLIAITFFRSTEILSKTTYLRDMI